ncbi:antibiotic biosynthesis monooxygenase [Streptomyces hirsutus]
MFTAVRTAGDDGYGETAEQLLEPAAEQPGFLGVDSARGADGPGITVSYWRDEESIAAWRDHAEHTPARAHGRDHWYASFSLHVAKVERAYGFTRPADVQMPPPPVLVIIHAGGSGIRGGGGRAVPGMRPAPGSPLPPRRTTGRPRTTRRGPSPARPAGRLRRRRDDRRLRRIEPHPDARPPAAHAGRGVPSPQPSDHALHRTEPGRPRSSPACGTAVAPSPTSSGRPGTGSPPLRRRWVSPP